MHRTPPSQKDKPAPLAPKRPAGRPNNAEKEETPCPIRVRETGKSTPQSEDTQINEKHGTVVAGTPILPPRATPVIDPTPLIKTIEQYDDKETPIPETPSQHIKQITEGNKTHLEEELLKILETAMEDLNKVNHRQINTIIETIKVSIKKTTIITQRMIIGKEFKNQFDKIEIKLDKIQKTISEPPKTYAEAIQR